jgi:ferrous iron transport protein B
MLVILADMPISATLSVFGIIFTQTLVAGMLANRLVPGLQPDFVMVIPPMRVPKLRHALTRTVRQTWYFMREAVPFFLLASLVLFVFDRIGGLALLERISAPLMNDFLGRRESGAAELDLLRGGFDNVQLVVTLLVMTFLTPCVNAMIVLAKERGLRTAAIIVGSISVYSILVGAAVTHVCRMLGVTFT